MKAVIVITRVFHQRIWKQESTIVIRQLKQEKTKTWTMKQWVLIKMWLLETLIRAQVKVRIIWVRMRRFLKHFLRSQ
jgi:hypothetical protein